MYNGCLYEVPCGRCPECALDKAHKNFSRMINFKDISHYSMLFCTFTYDNLYIPYILRSELFSMLEDGTCSFIHRDNDFRRLKSHGVKRVHRYKDLIFDFPCSFRFDDFSKIFNLPSLVKSHVGNNVEFYDDRVGLLFFKDIQNLHKSLRHYFDFEFFVCGEYGSEKEFFRPHWHALYYIPKSINFSLFSVSRLIRYFWKYSPKRPSVIMEVVSAEKYISMYLTKISKYPPSLFLLQRRMSYCSRGLCKVGVPFDLLDDSLHYHKYNNGLTHSYLPTSQMANCYFNYRCLPARPAYWYNMLFAFSSLAYHPYKVSSLTRIRCPTLSSVIDYCISAQEFHIKLNSQRLKDYLLENPTVYSNHKKEHPRVVYNIHDKKTIHWLHNYNKLNKMDISDIHKFNYQQQLNKLIYE